MHVSLRGVAQQLIPAMILIAACEGSKKTVVDYRSVRQSESATVSGAAAKTPAIGATYLAQLPAGQLRLETASSACPPSVIPFSVVPLQDVMFTTTLKNGCDYQLFMDLGAQEAAGFVAYYKSGSRMVTLQEVKDVLANVKSIQAVPTAFERTPAGEAKALPSFEVLTGASGVPTTTNAPSVDPVSPAFAQIQIEDQAGTKTTMDKVAHGKYMLIDISATSCGYCVDLANDINASAEFKKIMEQGKCSAATWIAAGSDYSAWKRKFPATTESGKHSYGVTSVHTASQAFGFKSASYTPYLFVVDVAAGKLHNNMEAIDLDEFLKFCSSL